MSGVWKRSHGRATKTPPDERGGNSYARPTATAPHLDSTHGSPEGGGGGMSALEERAVRLKGSFGRKLAILAEKCWIDGAWPQPSASRSAAARPASGPRPARWRR